MIVLFGSCYQVNKEDNNTDSEKQSILLNAFINSKDSNALKFQNIKTLNNDSVQTTVIMDLAYHYLEEVDSANFRFWNSKAFDQIKNKNSLNFGFSHWDLAYFFEETHILDSAYYHYYAAFKIFENSNDNLNSAHMLLNMAGLQNKINDHIGSEVNTVRALDLLEETHDLRQKYRAHNTMAIIGNGLQDYERSLENHFEARKVVLQLNDPVLNSTNLNNIGVVYKNLEDYESSHSYYDSALEYDSLKFADPYLYAKILDNQAYAEFHLDYEPEVFYPKSCNALQLRDSLNDIPGKIINHIHLGDRKSTRLNSSHQ